MKTSPTHRQETGFSLVETTISIGLVATVLLPIMALISTGQTQQRTSSDRVISTFIAESIISEVLGGLASDEFVTMDGETISTDALFPANCGPGDKAYLECASTGRVIRSIEGDVYEGGITMTTQDGDAIESGFVVKLELEQSSHPGTAKASHSTLGKSHDLVMMTVSIEGPAHVSSDFRDIETFTTLLRID